MVFRNVKDCQYGFWRCQWNVCTPISYKLVSNDFCDLCTPVRGLPCPLPGLYDAVFQASGLVKEVAPLAAASGDAEKARLAEVRAGLACVQLCQKLDYSSRGL